MDSQLFLQFDGDLQEGFDSCRQYLSFSATLDQINRHLWNFDGDIDLIFVFKNTSEICDDDSLAC